MTWFLGRKLVKHCTWILFQTPSSGLKPLWLHKTRVVVWQSFYHLAIFCEHIVCHGTDHIISICQEIPSVHQLYVLSLFSATLYYSTALQRLFHHNPKLLFFNNKYYNYYKLLYTLISTLTLKWCTQSANKMFTRIYQE